MLKQATCLLRVLCPVSNGIASVSIMVDSRDITEQMDDNMTAEMLRYMA